MSTVLAWFKSTHSPEQGGACVEVGYSWRKSSYSGSEGGACVEVSAHPAAIHIRDSKNPEGPIVTVDTASWSAFTAYAAA
ncbi:DUF397 domain-containing protein [Streptomyces sp. AM 2-1-1]|uniref:DUF397 domain-containing protein n=1 Tax=Streptomyces sp. AM 2-1-1 TaxID=3028709 RepID=UPI0023B98747|nr:DUF397 domain-containing protein [Streptomyces sp. AM 2-1-1]WEH40364.1 DUF397 domain-containing protein [Streptomyces sp. AM 2-1-1]